MTAIQPTSMDEFWANRIEGTGPNPWGHVPVSDRVARRQRIAESNPRYTPYVEALIEAQGAEPIRHRRASWWVRFTRTGWYTVAFWVIYVSVLVGLAALLVRLVDLIWGGAA